MGCLDMGSETKISVWSRKPLRAYLNIIKLSLERRLRKRRLASLPFVLYLEPNTFCNLSCPSCPTGTKQLGRPKTKVTIDEFKNSIDALGEYIFLLVMYNWGEPLLHQEFPRLVRYATAKHIVVHASSNLSMQLSEERCRDIVLSGLQLLLVGVDGATPETHESYRRGSNLPLVHENLRKLVRIKKSLKSETPHIVAIFLVFEHNEHELEDFKKQMDEIGVRYDATAPFLPPSSGLKKSKNEEFDRYLKGAANCNNLRRKGNTLAPCTWLYYSSIINPGGSISPCCMVANENFDFGKINQTPKNWNALLSDFRESWNGDKYRSARGLFQKDCLIEWSKNNLTALNQDGMALSQVNKNVSIICEECPIPDEIEIWSHFIQEMCTAFASSSIKELISFKLRNGLSLAFKASLLRIAWWLQ